MSYISLSEKEKKDMLQTIGVSSVDELFDVIPENIRLQRLLDVPGPMSEPELLDHIAGIIGRNRFADYLSFLGAGIYPHHIPTVVDYLSSRGEFVSPYTPYQPEVSQGTLQAIFEFQTMICQLTGMDIANASLYDGASGAAEAVLMANRINRKTKVLVPRSLHPDYRRTIQTYTRNLGISLVEIGYTQSGQMDVSALEDELDAETAAVLIQSPNFFGVVEDMQAVSERAHSHQALSIAVVTEALSLAILQSPGDGGADIVTGEAQSFGIPTSFGGPVLGFMACADDFIRQLPGRIAGETRDVDGRRGFVLTLSTREQHIRRERATSNICTNQALCLLRAAIYMEALGKTGLRQAAEQNIHKSRYAQKNLSAVEGISLRFSGHHFNEFVLQFSRPWSEIQQALRERGIVAGLGMERFFPEMKESGLICVTEVHKKADIDRLTEAFIEVMSNG